MYMSVCSRAYNFNDNIPVLDINFIKTMAIGVLFHSSESTLELLGFQISSYSS